MANTRIEDATLVYPEHHELRPEDFLHFIELDEFADDWELLGLDREEDLWALQILIMINPEVGDVVSGTGGLRKMRFGRVADQIGKRKGVRVCYVYFKEHWTVLLIAAYDKHEKDNLTPVEKKYIRQYIQRSKAWLESQSY